jgi:hypothetical protein
MNFDFENLSCVACARVFMSEVLILEKYEVKKGILPMNNVIGV